jgi:hypothetical protein
MKRKAKKTEKKTDKPEAFANGFIRTVECEAHCDICSEEFYDGDRAYSEDDPEDSTRRWFCVQHTPDLE